MNHVYGFWISPESEIHPVFNDYGHKELMENILGKPLDEASDDTDNTLFDDGWIRIVNTDKSLMVNYRCITSNKQIRAIEKIENNLMDNGCFHEQYILDYGYDYHFFNSFKEMIARIRERL